MKVALVHDYIKEYGGAERVLEALHELFPEAPVFTSVYLPNYLGPHKKRFEGWDIRPSMLQWIPLKAKLISPLRLIAPFFFKRMDFSEYDVVIISATGAYLPNLISKRKAIQICYCHTPPRYLYGYPTARSIPSFMKPFVYIVYHFLRIWDFESSRNVDYFIANSKETASRIEKFYKRDAKVIYPPVEIPSNKIQVKGNKKEYYLAGGRLARSKRIDLAVKACTELGLPLKVFGKRFAGYGDESLQLAGPTIEFLGEIAEEKKWGLMAGAKAFIFPAEFEDFGIIPVEAMAAGAPVIALRSGGVQESVVDGKTGVFFDEPNVESLKKAIKKFEKMKIKPEDCRKQAEKFSKKRFEKEIKNFLQKVNS